MIRTPDQRLRVFVSSTLGELAEERLAARDAITQLRLTPVLFELGARPHPPRPLYRAYLAQSDIFVGIYWQRYGWVAPDEEISGLEDEYRLAGDRPMLLYVKAPAPERDPELKRLLQHIQADDHVSYKPFSTAGELRELIEDDLAQVLTECFTQSHLPGRGEIGVRPHDNLPVQRSPLIDRASETAAARALLLREDIGLVTLTGAGGCGKTRLALHLAATLRDSFKDGLVFVPLASVTDPALVASTIAQALGLREVSGRPIEESLQDVLHTKHLLLLLDNAEHLLAAVPLVSRLLQHCPQLTILVTSRSLLHLYEEREVPIPPLALPDVDARPELDHLSQYAAVELFIQRAREIKPEFELTNETAPAVARICRRLDGLPLAIELAAARSKLFPPKSLLARLDRRLPLLVTGSADFPQRQQTLNGAIAWSYDLLNEEEKRLFRRLSVFVGGFTLEGAEAVCRTELPMPAGGTRAPTDSPAMLAGVESLLDNSLLWVQEGPSGEPRFGMLETIREYGRVRLAESGEEAELTARHGQWFLNLAEEAAPYLTGASRAPWLERLAADQDNLRAALRRGLDQEGESEGGVRLAGALSWFWYLRGHLAEGRVWLRRALATADARTPPAVRARVLSGIGGVAWAQSDFAAARQALDESIGLLRQSGDTRRLAHVLTNLGMVAENDEGGVVSLGLLRESRDLAREAGDPWSEGFSLFHLGNALTHTGDLIEAHSVFGEGLRIFEQLDDPWGRGLLLYALGAFSAVQHDYGDASDRLQESLSLFTAIRHELGIPSYSILALAGLADVARARGDYHRAARLFGAVARQIESMDDDQSAVVASMYAEIRHESVDGKVAAMRSEFAESDARAAWRDGQTMSLEEAVACAREKVAVTKPRLNPV